MIPLAGQLLQLFHNTFGDIESNPCLGCLQPAWNAFHHMPWQRDTTGWRGHQGKAKAELCEKCQKGRCAWTQKCGTENGKTTHFHAELAQGPLSWWRKGLI